MSRVSVSRGEPSGFEMLLGVVGVCVCVRGTLLTFKWMGFGRGFLRGFGCGLCVDIDEIFRSM